MQSFSSDMLPAKTRATAWNALYSQQLNRVDFTPANNQDFAAQLTLGKLGPIQFARMCSNRTNILRTRRHISPSAPRLYSFLLQTKGSGLLSHCGQEAVMTEGDFVLCDSAAPHSFTVEDDSIVVMMRVDAALLKTYLPTPEQFCGRLLKNEVGLTRTMSAMVEKFDSQLEAGFRSIYDERFARHVLEMLSMSYALGFSESSEVSAILRGRHAEVVRYIENNLRDPRLSPSSIAEGLRISPRYLRTIFASTGEKVSAYILRRRLEECAKQVRDPRWAGHTLTEIAFSWGFNSAGHFTRTFRDQFTFAPREYRREHLGE
ncbi:helix-turn-helix domain-containing protein [Altericroceibacterium endophyticum]|uniref:Helix-turn-helix domain-containing protein n=1 Tax=Altericroceibacterium endophyticum TaxID=1808508 RepID=A0A6I4T9Y7_9SPHN|nr:helix-turn-helix domain-containing protein [Altericroceibacterium endophyticum]MXO67112.1 helix-turn-helix domain-containing protein [Altericroceibacterium endophyticum]